ncbi:MAG TPA: energy transducer TonB [Caulobacteraceae bacterium]
MSGARTQRSPALIASAVVHAVAIAAALIVWPMVSKPLSLGKVVPVTLVTSEPPAEMAAAVQAPEPAPAATPQPEAQAPPEPAPIKPAPPAPPTASAAPKPALKTKPTPTKQAPSIKSAPAASAQAANKQDLDLDALMASIDSQRSKPAAKAASGQVGPLRPKTEKTASTGHGNDLRMSGDERQGLIDKLSRLWNPNCQVEAAAGVNVKVRFRLTAQGWVVGQPELADGRSVSSIGDPVVAAAAARALSAVGRGQPFTDVIDPAHLSGTNDFVINFVAKQACAGK